MTLGTFSPGALLTTALAASLYALFLDWRRRLVRRLGSGDGRSPRAARGGHEKMTAAAAAPTHHDVDDALEASFPASDPPSWTPSLARPAATVTPVSPYGAHAAPAAAAAAGCRA